MDRRAALQGVASKEASGGRHLLRYLALALELPNTHDVHDEVSRGSDCEREQHVSFTEREHLQDFLSQHGVVGQPLFTTT